VPRSVAADSRQKEATEAYERRCRELDLRGLVGPIDATSRRKVDDGSTLARLCLAARGNVLKAVVADEFMAKALASSGTRLSIDGRMMQLAQFPNAGYCHIGNILDKGAVYAHDRTMSDVPKYSMNAPAGAVFTIVEPPSVRELGGRIRTRPEGRDQGISILEWYPLFKKVMNQPFQLPFHLYGGWKPSLRKHGGFSPYRFLKPH
jgi:hypothetical protein